MAIAFWKGERAERIEVALFDAAPKLRPPPAGFEWEAADPLTTFDVKRFNAVRGYQAQQGSELSPLPQGAAPAAQRRARGRHGRTRGTLQNEPESPPRPTTTRPFPLGHRPTRAGQVLRNEPCLTRLWQKGEAPSPCRGWVRGVGDRNEPWASDSSPPAQRDPAPHPWEPERLSGASPQTRMGPGWNRARSCRSSAWTSARPGSTATWRSNGRRLRVSNDAAGIQELVRTLGDTAGCLVVMEASGGYERTAHRELLAPGRAGRDRQPETGARLRARHGPGGQDRPGRCPADRALWRR